MSSAQIIALRTGLIGSVAIWPLVVLTQLLVQRARHRSLDLRGLLVGAAATVYGCLALAVVMLPLPSPGQPRLTQSIQVVPFQWVADIGTELDKHGLTAADALNSQTFQQVAMNIVLFVPLGMLLWRVWSQHFQRVALAGLAVSVLIELTQLTANFGTAPYPYRICDIDDLLANTAGAVLGWALAALYGLLRAGTRHVTAATAARADAPPTGPLRQYAPTGPAYAGSPDALRVDPRTSPAWTRQ